MMQDWVMQAHEILNVCPCIYNNFTLWKFQHFVYFYDVVFLCLYLVCDKRIFYEMPDEIGEKRHNDDITMASRC